MKKLLLYLLVLSCFGVMSQNIIRVNINIGPTGARNGTSWPNARKHLQGALDVAQPGDEIWVAQGTYYPTLQNGLSFYARDISYKLVDGVAIYGGFDGTETRRQQRDWRKNETILSGDIGVVNDPSDNCFHVVLADTNITSPNTLLDGFTVRDGRNEQGRGEIFGGGVLVLRQTPIRLRNLIIKNNLSPSGAGLGIQNIVSNPLGNDTVLVANCIIKDNVAIGVGGGISVNNRHVKFYNCIVLNNVANNPNPAFYSSANGMFLANLGSGRSYLYNCTFGQFDTIELNVQSFFEAYNSVIAGSVLNRSAQLPTYKFKNCLVGNSGGSANWNPQDFGVDLGGNLNANPGFWAYDNPALHDTSRARDAGSNIDLPPDEADIDDDGNVTEPLPLDFYGNPRIFFATVDIGAAEYTPVKLDTVYHRICEYSTYSYGNQILRAPGTYIKTLISNPAGDTAEVLHLSMDSINTQIHIDPDGTYVSHEDSATYFWIDCSNADTVQSGPNQSFKPTKNGKYGVYIMNSLGCIKYSVCLEIKNVGLAEGSLQGFSLYPNPVGDELRIELKEIAPDPTWVMIYDLSGKVVLKTWIQAHQRQRRIDVCQLPPSVYTVKTGSFKVAFVKL